MTPSKDAPPSFIGLLKAYPWLGVLLALSLIVTVWAATRRAPPPPEPVPAAAPAVEAPAAAPEADPEPTVWPDMPPPAATVPAPAAPPARAASTEESPPPPPSSEAQLQPDGTWRTEGPGLGR